MRRQIAGLLWGEQRPPKPDLPPQVHDARTHALSALARYVGEIEYRILNPPGPPKAFRIPQDRIYIEWPEDWNETLLYPSIVFEPGPAQYLPRGLAPNTFEPKRLPHAPLPISPKLLVGTHEYEEKFVITIHASTREMRRSIASGIEHFLSAPIEQSPGIRLRLPDYHGTVASFQLEERTNPDDEESMKRRRRSRITCSMRVDVLREVNAQVLRPQVRVYTSDEAGPTPQT